MTIKLYQFPPALGLPNASPFCMKLETYLRMAGLPFENKYTPHLRQHPHVEAFCQRIKGKYYA